MDKRTFLKSASLLSLGSLASFSALSKIIDPVAHIPPATLAKDEDFWLNIRNGYDLPPNFINLENGFYNVMPREVMDRYIEHIRAVNQQGALYMRMMQERDKAMAARNVALMIGCAPEDLIITRNTTESLDTIISGINWKQGDEAVMAEQDYGAMLDMFAQVAKRHGLQNRVLSLDPERTDDHEIVELYDRAITPKTKLLMISHIVNITGQILPVRQICEMAHKRNVQVLVDGAHAVGQIAVNIRDLNCDYYGASLHKWLSAPLGSGILYVKKEHTEQIWPLFAESKKKPDDILKLNHTGTHPAAIDLAITDAISYYQKMGAPRKEERLRYLQNYWTMKARDIRHAQLYTPGQRDRSCAIATIGIGNMKPADLADRLFTKYKIYTVAIDNAGIKGVRITPNVYTTIAELDKLVAALTEISATM
jgi:selenocysteine lyase/cysteine desulfurase